MKKIFNIIRPFLTSAICFFAGLFSIKLFEFIRLYQTIQVSGFSLIAKVLLSCTISFALIAVGVFVLYVLIGFRWKKIALIVSSSVFALILLFELGLTLYSLISGALLGAEIILRPLSEIIQTIRGVANLWFVIPLLLIAATVFVLLILKVEAKKWRILTPIQLIALAVIVFALPFASKFGAFKQNNFSPAIENLLTNKSLHCVRSCMKQSKVNKMVNSNKVDKTTNFIVDSTLLRTYVSGISNRTIPDFIYPLEHINDEQSTLAPYFDTSSVKPNIVIIVVESLGRDWSGDTKLGVSFTPFLDSLSQHSLYWKNCLSTTKRSFGAVPAITGSLPHGPRGFQFGIMPAHNSLISILRSNGYAANAFYASDFTFDGVYEYLLAQQVDYMSTQFQKEAFGTKNNKLYTYWGYHDAIMFKRSLQELEKIDGNAPLFNIYITITAHDELNIRDEQEQNFYLEQTRKIINQLAPDKQKVAADALKHKASIYYTDCALRSFFAEYSRRPDFDSTIFIITGDHASGINAHNRIALYHVPLIIWSKMLCKTKQFPALVTHNDITPSLVSLLKSNFNLKTPEMVHWAGKNLSTTNTFNANNSLLLLEYAHEIDEMVHNGYFYRKSNNQLFKIDSSMNLLPIDNEDDKNSMAKTMELHQYINSYVYLKNRLTKHPIYTDSEYITVGSFFVDSLSCYSLEKKPSELPPKYYPIISKEFVANSGVDKIKITTSAEIMIEGDSYQDHQMNLIFRYDGNGKTQPNIYKEKISKFTNEEQIIQGKWYKINISKEFDVRNVSDIEVSVLIGTHDEDGYWRNNTLHMRNIGISIEKTIQNK